MIDSYTMECNMGLHEYKKTNADRIRSMTDEELAEFVENVSDALVSCEYCIPISYGTDGCCTGGCRNGVLNWLQTEVDE